MENMVHIILKKAHGERLTDREIGAVVSGYLSGDIPDYQMSAFLMAVCQRGMDLEECVALTRYMRDSGECLDLSAVGHMVCDKHSTGGVGDKTTLITLPVVAACGGYTAKMSGRGLGYTGGTIDKLQSIPGFCTSIPLEQFVKQTETLGLAIVEQMENLVPADKKIYALRDVTGTVESIPLIASSILSKKLAAGTDIIVIDVKYGSGAFMKDKKSASMLAETLKQVGAALGKCVYPMLSPMEEPLGLAVGNALEVKEAIQVLQGGGPEDIKSCALKLAAKMLSLSDMGTEADCLEAAKKSLIDGSAYEKFCQMVKAQGGESLAIEDVRRLPQAKFQRVLYAPQKGQIQHMQTDKIGEVSMLLGAGRKNRDDRISYGAGIMVRKKTGDFVSQNACIAELYSDTEEVLPLAEKRYLDALTIV